MVLSGSDRDYVIGCAGKYNVSALYSLDSFDGVILGVDGIDPRSFFRFYGDLLMKLNVRVDLYDMSVDSLYCGMLEKEGVKVYERSV